MFLSFILFLLRSLKKDDISRIFVASLTIISLIFNISRFRKKISRIFGFRCIFPFHTSYFPSFQHIIVRYIKTYLRFGVINYSVNSITRYNSLTKSHPNSEALFRTRSAVQNEHSRESRTLQVYIYSKRTKTFLFQIYQNIKNVQINQKRFSKIRFFKNQNIQNIDKLEMLKCSKCSNNQKIKI